jgi:hypothetical protein
VAGGWRRLHNVELSNMDASPDIVRIMKSGGWDGCSMYYA